MDQAATRNRKTTRGEIVKTVISILVLGVGIALFAIMYSYREPPPNKTSTVLIPLVSVVPAKPYTGKIDLVVSGLVQPSHEINVTSEVNGVVKVKHEACEAGTYVDGGTVLLEIDPADYNATQETNKADLQQAIKRVEEAEVEIVGAERNIQLAIRELALAESDHQRNLRLLSQRVISKAEADQTERALVAAKSQLTVRQNAKSGAEARLESAKASQMLSQTRIDQSQLTIDKLIVKCRKTGVVVRELVQEGDAVRVGTPLLTFEATGKVEVVTTLTQAELAWIRENKAVDTSGLTSAEAIAAAYGLPQAEVKIYDRNEPDVVWDGVLTRIDGIGRDDRTKTIPCRIVVEQPVVQSGSRPRALLRNSYVKCRIEVDVDESNADATPLVFPATALSPGGYVWTANKNRLDRKKVTVLDEIKDEKTGEALVVVRAGPDSIRVDDWVVVSPLNQPTVGAEARIRDEPEIRPKSKSESESESVPGSGSKEMANSGMDGRGRLPPTRAE